MFIANLFGLETGSTMLRFLAYVGIFGVGFFIGLASFLDITPKSRVITIAIYKYLKRRNKQ